MITTALLKEIILDQAKMPMETHLTRRDVFTQVEKFQNSPFIIIITGLRRCGKSTLMQMIRNKAVERDYFISFDDDRLSTFELSDFQILFECFIELYGEQKTIYLDEVQNIPEWERFARRLHDQGFKIYITGSNALMFSKELGTRLTGRYLPIEMYPFSFREFISYYQPELIKQHHDTHEKATVKKMFFKYLEIGGLPEYIRYSLEMYLHTLYENILYKDIIARYRLTNERAIKQLVYYLASNIAKDTNFSQLGKLIQTSSSSVSDYCHYLENCYLSFMINRYSHSLKQQLSYQKKNYFIDIALAKSIGFRVSEDHGRMLENVVFLELKRQNKDIFFHKENYECDFIIKDEICITEVIQVTKSLHCEKVKKREFSGLLEAMQSYNLEHGLILTDDEEYDVTETMAGKKYYIKIIPVWKWLLHEVTL